MKLFCISAILLISMPLMAQVGIGTATPNSSAQLDISSTTKGLLVPRMTAVQKTAIASPATGLLVYLIDSATGFYYYSGTAWIQINSGVLSGGNYVDLTTNQVINGTKTFNGDASIHTLTVGLGGGNINTNTAIGVNALAKNTTGNQNTATGYQAQDSNTTGNYNTANGYQALFTNTVGNDNTAHGYQALFSNTSGSSNTATGSQALVNNFTGSGNTATGFQALAYDSIGSNNTANGFQSLFFNKKGYNNTADGWQALANNTTGNYNTAIGSQALFTNTTGYYNTASGPYSLYSNLTGYFNSAYGIYALNSNTSGYKNSAYGYQALLHSISGNNNTAMGDSAATNLTTGSNNILIGFNAQPSTASIDNEVTLGNSNNNSYRMYAASWTNASDAKLKHGIRDIPVGLNFVKQLHPVEYVYNNADNGERSLGFIAQEVQKVVNNTGLVNSGLVTPIDNAYLGLKTTELIPILTKAIQEQQLQIEVIPILLKAIKDQQHEIDELKKLVSHPFKTIPNTNKHENIYPGHR